MQSNSPIEQPVVLFVDDEINILKSVKRALYKLDITLLFADSAEKAMQFISKQNVDVIVTDMKMPNTNGAELLKKVESSKKDIFRVVMTGYADVESIMSAVNEGKAHRILQKPWDNQELVAVIEEGTERSRLRRENAHLLSITQSQNDLLQDVNDQLENQVLIRTNQIKNALKRIGQQKNALQKVLYNVIVTNPDIDGVFARNVSKTAVALAEDISLNSKQIEELEFAGLICEIGLLGLSPELLRRHFEGLKYEEQQRYLSQVDLARLILAPIAELQPATHIVTRQFLSLRENPDLSEETKILAICRDYWRYRLGRISGGEMSHTNACAELRKLMGIKYDERILNLLVSSKEAQNTHTESHSVSVSALKEGMTLKDDIFNQSHILLLPKGHVFTAQSIASLQQFEKGSETKLSVVVIAAKYEGSKNDQQNS